MTEQELRKLVLSVMNTQRKKARHELEARMHLSQIEHAINKLVEDRIGSNQVLQAVDYLYGAKQLKRSSETSTTRVTSRAGASSRYSPAPRSFKNTNFFYTLTNSAIDELDGATEYTKPPFRPFGNISITANNSAVVIGSNNKVENNAVLFNQLNELQQALLEAVELTTELKQDAASDVESLKQQLTKPNPSHAVINALWATIGHAADLAGAAQLAVVVAQGIATLTGHHLG